MPPTDVVQIFRDALEKGSDISAAVAAIHALTCVARDSGATTVMGLQVNLKAAADALIATNKGSISLTAGCELFLRYVTRTQVDIPEFDDLRAMVVKRGQEFEVMSLRSRKMIADFGLRFIRDGNVILTHGYSRVVLAVLQHASAQGRQFDVIVPEGRNGRDSDCNGYKMAAALNKLKIPVTLITDSAVGSVMHKCNFVLCGGEGIAENGGIINQVGTFPMAVMAKTLNKKFYVASESYKFARVYPLSQDDIPNNTSSQSSFVPFAGASSSSTDAIGDSVQICNPMHDFTPPDFITLLFTDLGILTPSAVSDELIKLYY